MYQHFLVEPAATAAVPTENGTYRMKPIIVVGHRSPDNDSVSSAVAWAHLRNVTDPDNAYVAARLGDMPRESTWAFERWGAEEPMFIDSVAPGPDGVKQRVALVDHNEYSQSAPGIEEAEIVEIVDHHRIGGIQTAGPIFFMNLPIGSTASVIALRYREVGVEMPTHIAGILFSALLTDTVLLKSPTTTDVDRELVKHFEALLGLDYQEYGMALLKSRNAGVPFSANRVVTLDLKEYDLGSQRAALGQFETVDLAEFHENRESVVAEMERIRQERDYNFLLLMATDIIREGSEIVVVGDASIPERGLGIDLSSGSAWMDGIMSRKKQVAAPIVEAAS